MAALHDFPRHLPRRLLRRLLRGLLRPTALFAVLPLAGCLALAPRVEMEETAPPPPATPALAAPSGSIYQSAAYRPLFEDYRARMVGDTLVVQIVEKITAVQKSTSSVDKGGNLSASVTALPGINPNSFTRASAAGSSSNTFSGKGAVENSNDFSGTITVVVREVLPNGMLVVAGEKQIGVNANVDVLRFAGQVDPRAILPGNTVASSAIANVRLEQRGRGQQAEAQAIGWLGRVFLSVLPF